MDSNPLLKLYQASRAVNKRKQMAHHANRRNYVNYETTSTMSPYQPKPFHGHSLGGGRNRKGTQSQKRNAVPDEGVLHL